MFSIYAQILSAHSPQVLKYFPRILCVRRKNEEYAERIFSPSTMPGDFKGKVFRKNRMGGYMLAQDEQFTKKKFWLSIKQKLLYAYMETTLNGEISTESVYNSVNNNTNLKKILILSIYTIWNRLSLKTISRYCPFKYQYFIRMNLKSMPQKASHVHTKKYRHMKNINSV